MLLENSSLNFTWYWNKAACLTSQAAQNSYAFAYVWKKKQKFGPQLLLRVRLVLQSLQVFDLRDGHLQEAPSQQRLWMVVHKVEPLHKTLCLNHLSSVIGLTNFLCLFLLVFSWRSLSVLPDRLWGELLVIVSLWQSWWPLSVSAKC